MLVLGWCITDPVKGTVSDLIEEDALLKMNGLALVLAKQTLPVSKLQ